jgi:hypothetical protein
VVGREGGRGERGGQVERDGPPIANLVTFNLQIFDRLHFRW